MYIVREKATRKILHINPAPVSQKLEGTDVYHLFDPKTMEVGRGEPREVPKHFDIDDKGTIVPWTLQRQVDEGVLKLPPEKKVSGDHIVEKTLAEKVQDGVVKLKPTEKLAGDHIEQKTVAEQVAEGLIQLGPTQVLDGEQIREMTQAEKAAAGLLQLPPHLKVADKRIVRKTRAEMAQEGLLDLAPDEMIKDGQIVKLTPRQMLDEGRYDLGQYKQAVIGRLTEASLAARRKQVPDHELLYAAIGALDGAAVTEYKQIIVAHMAKLTQTKQAIESASTGDEVDSAAGLGEWPAEKVPRVG